MSAKTFARWQWYEQVEPFGELRADWRAAQIVSMIHNVAVKPEAQKGPAEFLLKFVTEEEVKVIEESKKQTPEEQVRILNILAAVFNTPEA